MRIEIRVGTNKPHSDSFYYWEIPDTALEYLNSLDEGERHNAIQDEVWERVQQMIHWSWRVVDK